MAGDNEDEDLEGPKSMAWLGLKPFKVLGTAPRGGCGTRSPVTLYGWYLKFACLPCGPLVYGNRAFLECVFALAHQLKQLAEQSAMKGDFVPLRETLNG